MHANALNVIHAVLAATSPDQNDGRFEMEGMPDVVGGGLSTVVGLMFVVAFFGGIISFMEKTRK